jgi:hypothetical protein
LPPTPSPARSHKSPPPAIAGSLPPSALLMENDILNANYRGIDKRNKNIIHLLVNLFIRGI